MTAFEYIALMHYAARFNMDRDDVVAALAVIGCTPTNYRSYTAMQAREAIRSYTITHHIPAPASPLTSGEARETNRSQSENKFIGGK